MEHDVIIVGAGLSGIGAAVRVKTLCPELSFTVLEARETIGGTWDLFRYPGIRSDSDMFTLGYPFSPWRDEKAIADGPSILSYVQQTAKTFGIEPHLRFQHRVKEARWSSETARWTIDVEVGPEKAVQQLTARFLYLCCGYYDYAAAHAPKLEGIESFQGRVVHPQWWPADLDYAGKRVVVIGSGATAVTLVPSLAAKAGHVTMLQRSPTWIISMPAKDRIADLMRWLLPRRLAHALVRAKNVVTHLLFYLFCRSWPKPAARLLLSGVRRLLPKGYPVEKHFTPRYDPWDQRLCLVPDADLFKAITAGRAEVVTDTIETFDAGGIRLTSGARLDADLVVTATGLKILPVGGIKVRVDGHEVKAHDTLVYKGMMLSGVPNLAWCVGYTNASWTLRADLSSRYMCRLLKHMRRQRFDIAVPRAESAGPGRRPLLDLHAGYLERAASELPLQGVKAPWYLRQNYVLDLFGTLFGRVDDHVMEFSRVHDAAPRPLAHSAAESKSV